MGESRCVLSGGVVLSSPVTHHCSLFAIHCYHFHSARVPRDCECAFGEILILLKSSMRILFSPIVGVRNSIVSGGRRLCCVISLYALMTLPPYLPLIRTRPSRPVPGPA